ncbi:MAG: GntR family transcriptional regulator, partial [Sulfitobacter sp.]
MSKNSIEMTGGRKTKPLHEQIKDKILQNIIVGDWPEGFPVPAEMELASEFGVSYGTIRRAMDDLTQQGVIMRRRRTGTVVTGRTPHHTLSRFYRFYRLHTLDGRLTNTDAQVLKVEHAAPTPEEADELRLTDTDIVIRIKRLRVSESKPVMIDRCVLPLKLAPDFPTEAATAPPMIYKWLLDQHGLQLSAVRERITARLASPEDCELLELPATEPHAMLDISETAYDSRNQPLLIMRHTAV